MNYKCLECGHVFGEEEIAVWNESRGEYWGSPCFEKVSGCPKCKGSYEKTMPCKICKSEHFAEELNGGVCDKCINERKKDFDLCLKLSSGITSEIEINHLLVSLLDITDIEHILIEHIRSNWKDVDCSPFIDEDKCWFGEVLAKEVTKNEKVEGKS